MGWDDDLILSGLYLLHCIEKIRSVTWQGDPVWHHPPTGICSHGDVAFSLHVCRTAKSEP
ncbi:hypothetical protein EJD97_013725 [Solanum chilense]|uniref:Uncharacterized protein n=1 Tax=Solanum chilense TaxID=4083 RepID=A0A6N2BFX0_SOLCI|nr:hypothetical protein EJD97_013725 [Solanum chilense]